MDLRGLATSTKSNDVHWVYQLAKQYHRSPDCLFFGTDQAVDPVATRN
jgi:hypothetical protein